VRHEVRRALGVSRRDRPGPVHVSLPSDVLESEASRSEPGPEETVAAQGLNVEQAEEIVEWLGRASRPLVLAGPQARTPRLRAQLETLRDALGLPCLAMESPRGLQDPALGALAEVARCADAILLVGKRVDFTLAFGDAFDPGTSFMQVDPEVAEIERARKALGGRLRATLLSDVDSALAALLPQRSVTRHQAWCDEVDAAVLTRPVPPRSASGARMHPLDVARALRPLFVGNPGAIMVADGGEFAQWAQAVLDPARRIINGPAGAIGPALPMAVAARLCHPDQPVVAFLGDGTFGFHAAEIDTAVRYGLPFLAVVGNDARWNAEYQIQLRTYGPARTVGCELLPTRYDMVATGFGGYGECVANAEQLDAAVTRALDSGLPACLNVAIESVAAPSVKRVQA